jgi:hypothetical protein
MNLKQIITHPEGRRLEFKESLPESPQRQRETKGLRNLDYPNRERLS